MTENIKNFRKKVKSHGPLTPESLVNKSIDDITNVRINWRTAYKLSKYCCICGSTNDIRYHHVKHIRVGKVTGFLQVMKQLNRKQIPVCSSCHCNIHAGRYDNFKLTDLFDAELVIL